MYIIISSNNSSSSSSSSSNMSLVLRLPRDMHLSRSSSNAPRLPSLLEICHKTPTFCSLLTRCACFARFDLEMCFALQRRALFRHLNFQKWSDVGVFCTFWLRNLLRATTACNFSTSQLLNVLRSWSVLCILTSKSASRHNSVQFFISHLARWLRTRHFSKPTFRPVGATNHWKNTMFRDFSTFSRTYIFFLLTLSLLWPSLFFSSLLFSDSSHLCFSICPYCRKFDF